MELRTWEGDLFWPIFQKDLFECSVDYYTNVTVGVVGEDDSLDNVGFKKQNHGVNMVKQGDNKVKDAPWGVCVYGLYN